jgi:hypothetical protein
MKLLKYNLTWVLFMIKILDASPGIGGPLTIQETKEF